MTKKKTYASTMESYLAITQYQSFVPAFVLTAPNTCKFYFNQIKCCLKEDTLVTLNEPEMATGEAQSSL